MAVSLSDARARARQSFADQFEQDGDSFVYRQSQKGPAIRVSRNERDNFLEEFDRNYRRSTMLMYVGLVVVIGATILVSALLRTHGSTLAMAATTCAAILAYVAYFKWVWAAPARELAGRTPIAGERSPDEVNRLRFQRISYQRLGTVALMGLAFPFVFSRGDVFHGWNRIWLVAGGAFVLLALVQAGRKWRVEREYAGGAPVGSSLRLAVPSDGPDEPSQHSISPWSFLPLIVLGLGIGFVGYTAAGKRLSQTPEFWPVVMGGCGCWSLVSVVLGLSKGRIQPFARGFSGTYLRQTQPKRFWASMTWNALFACGCFWLALRFR